MKKTIVAMALALYLSGVTGAAYAETVVTATYTPTSTQTQGQVSITEIENSAGILPNSIFYVIERKIEELTILITKSEEKLAALKAQYATERAAEAAVMVNEGENEIAGEAANEYIKLLDSATKHINNAIKAKDESVESLETLNAAYKRSGEILKTVLAKAPADAKAAIETALNNQDKAILAVSSFQAAKKAFFAAKDQLEAAQKELKEAKKNGEPEAIKLAEEKVKVAEALKDELEELKDSVDLAKEDVKKLAEQVEKRIESGMKEIEKANEKMEKLEEKAAKKAEKAEEKIKKEEEKKS